MLKELHFVRGSVGKSKVDFALSHFKIQGGRVKGFNGLLSICAPIPLDLDCQPDAKQLIQAIGNCRAAVELSPTSAGKIRLKSGSFKAFINCYNDEIPDVEPEGERVPVNGTAMLSAMQKLIPFVGDDETQMWTNGVMFRDKSAFATNNVCIVEAWIGSVFPMAANVPASAVRELLRINEVPEAVSQTENSMTFYYPGDRWLRTQLYTTNWPDMKPYLEQPNTNPTAIPLALWDGLDSIRPFQDKLNRVYFHDGVMSTSLVEDEGASVQITGMSDGVFNINTLLLLKDTATKIDFTPWPAPCVFRGDKIRGSIVGLRN